ncbi:hypothetical protein FJZ41_01850 [Candidatus Shapirobacteria bacterium]|nr:hypothetical protein [Candidatus Shapirobacteria bacterium]
MRKFLKNYWLIISLAFTASLLAGIFFIQGKQETKPDEKLLSIPSPKLPEYQVRVPLNYNDLSENFPEISRSELVYKVEKPSFSDQEAIKIAKNLGFEGQPEFKNFENKIYYDWADSQKNLSINLTEGQFNFNKNLNLNNNPSVSLPEISQINSIIESVLQEKELLVNKEINLLIKDKSYLKSFGLEYGVTNNPEEAFAIEVKLQYELKNIRFLENDITILIGDKNEILKLEYRSIFKNLQVLEAYPLKNKQEIIEGLNSLNSINYFKIINDYELTAEPQRISKIDFNKIELVYVKTETPQSYLQPIFFISGQAVLNDGRTAEVGLYLPAIKDEYLLK